MLSEDTLADDAGASSPSSATLSATSNDAARSDGNKPRKHSMSTLIPTRRLTIGAMLVGILALVGGIVALDIWAEPITSVLEVEVGDTLSLAGSRSIASWFAASLLGVEGLLALAIYSLRRQRVDDYHGRYRVWTWIAAGCLLASLCQTTDVPLMAKGGARRLAQLGSMNEDLVWYTLVSVALAGFAIRLIMEVRASRQTLTMLGLSLTSFLLAALAGAERIQSLPEVARPLVAGAGWLVGVVGILAAFMLYARRVVFEMEGRVATPTRRKKTKSAKVTKSSTSAETKKKAETEQPSSAGSSASAPRLRMDTSEARGSQSSHSSATSSGDGGLSRAERRKMRREARRAA